MQDRFSGSGEAGFSLIEVMVVVTIVAILSLTAVLGLRLAPGNTPAPKIDNFARGVRYLQAESLFTNRSFAIGFAEHGWEVLIYSDAEKSWRKRDPAALHGSGDWGGDNEVTVQIEGRPITVRAKFPDLPTPDVFLLPSGETTPFRARLADTEGRSAVCTMESYGEMQCQWGS